MKAPVTAIIATLVAILSFVAGRWGSGKDRGSSDKAPAGSAAPGDETTASSLAGSSRKAKSKADPEGRPANFVSDHALTVEEARALTSEERMALITRGGMSWNSGNQAALMCGVIAALTEDEIGPATQILGGIQDRGNFQTQEVWDALWTQWGRVNPTKALEFFANDDSGKSKGDARHMMTGWLEADPLAAFTWAKQPKQSGLEAAAAALAITRNANGDPKRMEASILALPADEITRSACLQDYFDLASMAGEGLGAAETYDQLPSALRSAGWPVTMQRMIHQDPQAAAEWLATHSGDAGRNYQIAHEMVGEMVSRNPAATLTWAMKLPGLYDTSSTRQVHPAEIAISQWLEVDRPAATAWLQSHSADASWTKPLIEGE